MSSATFYFLSFVLISCRHNSFKRHLPRQMQVGSLDLGNDYVLEKDDKSTSLGRIQPELYQQKDLESEDSSKNSSSKNCGSINFSLKYDYENEALLVDILKAVDLPAKDLCGTSDPYVKVYLLPDRKKFQTRVHRKTLNPTFSESFQFPVPYDELAARKLHMSVFDFDRFSRHDMIGEVELDNLLEISDLSRETNIWRDIQYATSVRAPLPSSPNGSEKEGADGGLTVDANSCRRRSLPTGSQNWSWRLIWLALLTSSRVDERPSSLHLHLRSLSSLQLLHFCGFSSITSALLLRRQEKAGACVHPEALSSR